MLYRRRKRTVGSRNEESRRKFLNSPNQAAMIRAIVPSDAFVPKQQSIKAKVKMYSLKVAAKARALIDSGATENFISPSFISRYNIPTHSLSKPKIVRNVDGTKNRNGNIEELVNFEIAYLKINGQLKYKMQTFLILDLGEDDMILGYPFLQATNPEINWTEGNIKGTLWASTEDIAKVRKSTNPDKPESKIKVKVDQFKQWIKHTTIATQLAMRKAPKQDLPWHKQVPKEYHKYHKVFSEEAAQRFPKTKTWDHAIDLQPDAPKTLDCKLYPLAPGEQDSLDLFLKDHLRKGYIRPSKSPYSSPFFFIKKKDGKLRPVQDYRKLNEWTVQNKYPLPLIKELIAKLLNKTWFTKFDVRWGYNNVRIKDGDQWKAAFKTNKGLFEPMVMFFGLTNSPATFQTMMDDIFRSEIALGYVIIYMDDILIATQGDLKDHQKHVAYILNVLQQHDLYLKPKKCSFHKKEVEYLGVIVGNGKVKMDPIKVQALTDWPQPTTLKQKFTSYPVLRNPDPNKRFILDTDASAHAVGASLSQEFDDGFHPTAYFSKSLIAPERNYNIYDRELLSIIYAVKAFRYLLLGAKHKFLIRSDHNNLKYFRSAKRITPRQARWTEFLQDYDFELEHFPGKSNTIADLLSRKYDLNEVANINENVTVLP